MNPKRIIYSLATQYENFGDLMINSLLIRELMVYCDLIIEDKGIPREFLDAVSGGEVPLLSAECRELSPRSVLFFLRNLFGKSRIDGIFGSPGHISYSGRSGFIKLGINSAYMLAGILFSVRFHRIGVSHPRFSGVTRVLNQLSYRLMKNPAVRDPASKMENGLKCEVLPDLIYLLSGSSRHSFTDEGHESDSVALSFRGDNRSGAESEIFLDAVVGVCGKLHREHGLSFSGSFQVDKDGEFMRRLSKRLSERQIPIKLSDAKIDSWQDLSSYKRSLCVISNRLHVALTANVIGGVGIAMVDCKHDGKIIGAFSTPCLQSLCLPAEDGTDIVERVVGLMADDRREKLRGDLERENRKRAAVLRKGIACTVT